MTAAPAPPESWGEELVGRRRRTAPQAPVAPGGGRAPGRRAGPAGPTASAVPAESRGDEAPEGLDWLYARVYCAGDDTDVLLPGLGEWLTGLRSRLELRSAHFLRYIDQRGHHLRVRLQGEPACLDEAAVELDALDGIARRAQAGRAERLVPDTIPVALTGRPGLSLALYGPEYAKYGGVEGVERAERHFDLSSRWCLAHRVWTWPRPQGRVALAAHLLALVAVRGQVPAQEMLAAHLRAWGARLPAGMRAQDELIGLVTGVVEQCERQAEDLSALDELAGDAVRTTERIGVGVGARRVVDLVHMDVNRLGVSPAEECVAGLAARHLVGTGVLRR
ncbi:thiopeptide-type bacteriocin biosynthesis domain [Actinomyces howellii]|uniref:Thiopeptide-type bacteriocin biosynthesis domain n=1 Tax=Actinomyces howellii TaxID=52771 RepID=A0A3S5EH31_9ACTO|nr:thiopeptide-type bacteriocin biosynthesis domain [Actinomyces howellii]